MVTWTDCNHVSKELSGNSNDYRMVSSSLIPQSFPPSLPRYVFHISVGMYWTGCDRNSSSDRFPKRHRVNTKSSTSLDSMQRVNLDFLWRWSLDLNLMKLITYLLTSYKRNRILVIQIPNNVMFEPLRGI